MSIREVVMFAASCDRCGRHATYGDEFVAWADEAQAVAAAIDGEELTRLDSGRLVCDEWGARCWTWSDDENEKIELPPVEIVPPSFVRYWRGARTGAGEIGLALTSTIPSSRNHYGTDVVRIAKRGGGTDYIARTHIEPIPEHEAKSIRLADLGIDA